MTTGKQTLRDKADKKGHAMDIANTDPQSLGLIQRRPARMGDNLTVPTLPRHQAPKETTRSGQRLQLRTLLESGNYEPSREGIPVMMSSLLAVYLPAFGCRVSEAHRNQQQTKREEV